jgi:hypothetical protein
MSQHTKGPWSFYTHPQPNGCPVVGGDGVMVAMLAHSVSEYGQKEEALANARLIAAAPELLTWLKWASKRLPEDVKQSWQYEELCKTLAKAEVV